jgi:uncharacterized protein YbjQ (UPF0145 family)
MEFLFITVFLLIIGYVFGQRAEKKHYQAIEEREERYLNLPCTNMKLPLRANTAVQRVELVTGSVVISIDYFKQVLAGLRRLVGGQVNAYETLVDRARREAVLRMKSSCPNADEIINLRLETSSISKGQQNQVGSVEVLAYGTAVYYNQS